MDLLDVVDACYPEGKDTSSLITSPLTTPTMCTTGLSNTLDGRSTLRPSMRPGSIRSSAPFLCSPDTSWREARFRLSRNYASASTTTCSGSMLRRLRHFAGRIDRAPGTEPLMQLLASGTSSVRGTRQAGIHFGVLHGSTHRYLPIVRCDALLLARYALRYRASCGFRLQ